MGHDADFVYENRERGNRAKAQISPLKPCQPCQQRAIWRVWHGTIRPDSRKLLVLLGMNGGDGDRVTGVFHHPEPFNKSPFVNDLDLTVVHVDLRATVDFAVGSWD